MPLAQGGIIHRRGTERDETAGGLLATRLQGGATRRSLGDLAHDALEPVEDPLELRPVIFRDLALLAPGAASPLPRRELLRHLLQLPLATAEVGAIRLDGLHLPLEQIEDIAIVRPQRSRAGGAIPIFPEREEAIALVPQLAVLGPERPESGLDLLLLADPRGASLRDLLLEGRELGTLRRDRGLQRGHPLPSVGGGRLRGGGIEFGESALLGRLLEREALQLPRHRDELAIEGRLLRLESLPRLAALLGGEPLRRDGIERRLGRRDRLRGLAPRDLRTGQRRLCLSHRRLDRGAVWQPGT